MDWKTYYQERHFPVDVPLLHKVGIHPAHIVVGEWQRKELLWFRVSFRRRPKSLSLLSAQQFCNCLLKGASVVHPYEVDGVTALLRIMVEPLAASYSHTVICGQTLIPARGE